MARGPGHARATLTPRPAQEHRQRISAGGQIPAPEAPLVQVFGRKDSRDTQKALRYFKERRVAIDFVDLSVKPMAPTELKRFAARHGARAVLDEEGRAFRDAGLAYLRLDEDELFGRLLADQRLIRLPLIRCGNRVAVGVDEKAWKALVTPA